MFDRLASGSKWSSDGSFIDIAWHWHCSGASIEIALPFWHGQGRWGVHMFQVLRENIGSVLEGL